MDIIRNFISISGIAGEDELPAEANGQIIQYSENEIIFIPETQPEIKNLFHIMLKVELKESRKVNTPFGTTVILDGSRRLKVIYSAKSDTDNANLLNLELPFNTFVELPKDISADNINVYVLDAYFSLLDGRRLYSHTLYLVYVRLSLNELTGINSNKWPNLPPKNILDEKISLPGLDNGINTAAAGNAANTKSRVLEIKQDR